jgi:hypothetical protein
MFRIGPADDLSQLQTPAGFDHQRIATPARQWFHGGKAAKLAALAKGNQVFGGGLHHDGSFW